MRSAFAQQKPIQGFEEAPTDPNRLGTGNRSPTARSAWALSATAPAVSAPPSASRTTRTSKSSASATCSPIGVPALAKACRCEKTYPSLEELVKDDTIEAVFVATDAPSHARHCIEVLKHGKHVACAVPAVYGSLEDADKLFEAVKTSGLKYMMFETSCFHADCYAMRQIYQAEGFGRLVYSEGEYYHFHSHQIGSYKNWRVGSVPLWYPTHSTAYYVGVTDKPFTSVSCTGSDAGFPAHRPGANQYNNTFTDQIALFETAEGGASRMLMCMGTQARAVRPAVCSANKAGWTAPSTAAP